MPKARLGWKTRCSCIAIALYSFLLANGLSRMQERLLACGRWLPDDATAEVGVVLGYALKRNGTPTAPLRLRVDAAVALYEEGRIDNILFSGGHPGGGLRNMSEAEAMKRYAMEISGGAIPRDRIVLEELSTSTRTNAVNSLQLIAARRWKSVVVITNPFHQFRSVRTFRCAAKQTLPPEQQPEIWLGRGFGPKEQLRPPARALYELQLQRDIWREFLAVAYYWVRGWLC